MLTNLTSAKTRYIALPLVKTAIPSYVYLSCVWRTERQTDRNAIGNTVHSSAACLKNKPYIKEMKSTIRSKELNRQHTARREYGLIWQEANSCPWTEKTSVELRPNVSWTRVERVCGRFGPRLWCGQETVRPPAVGGVAAVGVPDAMRSGQASVRRRRTARRQRQVDRQLSGSLAVATF